jgi:hypothetical protein
VSRLGAVLLGLVLFALPFLKYGVGGHAHGPHTDHAPRHGGELLMVGDYHLERVVRGPAVEIFVSDALRRPVRPASARMLLDDGTERPLTWRDHRLVAPRPTAPGGALYEVTVSHGPVLSNRFH